MTGTFSSSVFQIQAFGQSSGPPTSRYFESGLHCRNDIPYVWPSSVRRIFTLFFCGSTSHMMTVVSFEPVANFRPSGENFTYHTSSQCSLSTWTVWIGNYMRVFKEKKNWYPKLDHSHQSYFIEMSNIPFPYHSRGRSATGYFLNPLSMQRHGTYSVPLAFPRPAWATPAIGAVAALRVEADMFEGDRLIGCATHRPSPPNSNGRSALRCSRTSSATTIDAHVTYYVATVSIHYAKRVKHPIRVPPPSTPGTFVPTPKISFPRKQNGAREKSAPIQSLHIIIRKCENDIYNEIVRFLFDHGLQLL